MAEGNLPVDQQVVNNIIGQQELLDNRPDLLEIELQLLGLYPQDTSTAHYQLFRDQLVSAYSDLNLVHNYAESQVELGVIPQVPVHVQNRVNHALFRGMNGLNQINDVQFIIGTSQTVTQFLNSTRYYLLAQIRKQSPDFFPDSSHGRFEPRFRPNYSGRPFTTASRTPLSPWRHYFRH